MLDWLVGSAEEARSTKGACMLISTGLKYCRPGPFTTELMLPPRRRAKDSVSISSLRMSNTSSECLPNCGVVSDARNGALARFRCSARPPVFGARISPAGNLDIKPDTFLASKRSPAAFNLLRKTRPVIPCAPLTRGVRPMTARDVDVTVNSHGSLFLFQPHTAEDKR